MNTMNDEPKLLPCPFCGGERLFYMEGSTFRWLLVACASCDGRAGEVRRVSEAYNDPYTIEDKQAAADAWNSRATGECEES